MDSAEVINLDSLGVLDDNVSSQPSVNFGGIELSKIIKLKLVVVAIKKILVWMI